MVKAALERTSRGDVEARGRVSGDRRVLSMLLVQLSLGDVLLVAEAVKYSSVSNEL